MRLLNMAVRSLGALAVLLFLARSSSAQDPAAPPPSPGGRGRAGSRYLELLPDIGRIGSQVGFEIGRSWNPYEVGPGLVGSGYIDVPLARGAGGRLSYEILLALSHATSPSFVITDPIAYVANLGAGASPSAALAGPPAAPFPVRRDVRTRLRLLQVSPFSLKYTVTRFDAQRIRPYVAAGMDFVVVITRQDPVSDESLQFRGTAPFDDPLIGGLVSQAPELTARGYPSGQGNIELGAHTGGGLELRMTRGLSLNVHYRFTAIGERRHHALASGLGFHW